MSHWVWLYSKLLFGGARNLYWSKVVFQAWLQMSVDQCRTSSLHNAFHNPSNPTPAKEGSKPHSSNQCTVAEVLCVYNAFDLLFPQRWPGSSLFLWGEWCVQAGDLWRGDLVQSCSEETPESFGLCPMSFPWMWLLLWQLMGHSAVQQAHHHRRQVACYLVRMSVIRLYVYSHTFDVW